MDADDDWELLFAWRGGDRGAGRLPALSRAAARPRIYWKDSKPEHRTLMGDGV